MLPRRCLAGTVLAGTVLALAGCAASPEEDDPFAGPSNLAQLGRQLTFSAGLREFEDGGFGRLDSPVLLALDYCEPMGLERVRLEGGLHYTYDEADGFSGGQDVRLKGDTFELSAGLNYSYLLQRVRPYLGFGGSILFLNLRGIDEDVDAVFDDEDMTAGGYAKAGLLFQVSRTSHVGVELRHFEGGEVSLDGTDLSTNYDQFVLVFGTSFE
jgi:hypothetical protein